MGKTEPMLGTSGKYKPFEEALARSMPELLAEGRKPLNTAEVMQMRLESRDYRQFFRESWNNNTIMTSDAIVFSASGYAKVLLDCERLKKIGQRPNYDDGDILKITEEEYRALEAPEFTPEWLTTGSMDKTKILNHKLWETLARDNDLLIPRLRGYTEHVLKSLSKTYMRDRKNPYVGMSVFNILGKDSPLTIRCLSLGPVREGSNLEQVSCLVGSKERFVVGVK